MNDDKRDDLQPKHESASGGEGLLADRARRRLTGAGLGAPILMTLMSRPAFGAQCLSNMLSGNLSDPNRGTCSKGSSPVGWGNPGGTVAGLATKSAWSKTGYAYGNKIQGKSGTSWDHYTGGATMSLLPFRWPDGHVAGTLTMRELAGNPAYANTTACSYLVAYLNAKLSAALAPTGFQYVLTPAQVEGLIVGTIALPPPYMSLKDFFDSTW